MKLSWHPTHKLWCKIIGKRITQDGTRLIQAQHYFCSERDTSETAAASLKEQWRHLKRTWKRDHEPDLLALGEPFPTIPHWYKIAPVIKQSISEADEKEKFAERDDLPPEEIAVDNAAATLDEIKALFFAHRRTREGVDFQDTSNKSFETNLNAAFRFVDGSKAAAKFTADGVDIMRVAMLKSKGMRLRTIRNYGMSFKAMLKWYWKSPMFRGGMPIGDFDAEFSKFPKIKNATPNHLSLETMKTIFAEATPARRLYLLLMLNLGMQPTDIASVPASGFKLLSGMVEWKRKKNDRINEPSDVVVISRMWPETAEVVSRFLATSGTAFRNEQGGPLAKITANRNRNNAVTKSLEKLFERLSKKGVDATAKNFRQTGAQLIHEVSDYDLSRIWLGRGFESVDRAYLRQTYAKLDAASELVRQQLIDAGVLPLTTLNSDPAARAIIAVKNLEAVETIS